MDLLSPALSSVHLCQLRASLGGERGGLLSEGLKGKRCWAVRSGTESLFQLVYFFMLDLFFMLKLFLHPRVEESVDLQTLTRLHSEVGGNRKSSRTGSLSWSLRKQLEAGFQLLKLTPV